MRPLDTYWNTGSDLAPPSSDVTAAEKEFLRNVGKEMQVERRQFGVKLPDDIERRMRDRRLVNVRRVFGTERRAS